LWRVGRVNDIDAQLRHSRLHQRLPPHGSSSTRLVYSVVEIPLFEMDQLSSDDRKIVERYPLKDTLDPLRSLLQRAESLQLSDELFQDSTRESPKEKSKTTVSRLLGALLAHPVPLKLRSRSRNQNMTLDLVIVYLRAQNGEFEFSVYRSLCLLVINEAPDVEIWSAVFNLIATVSRKTPPACVAPSFDSTPLAYSSASQQGSEQTRKLLEPLLLHEFGDCTYRNVGGFFTKYFEGKEWSDQAQKVYHELQDRYVDDRWIDFPDPPVEGAVWNWLSDIQERVLSDARGVYYTTKSTADLVGLEAKRQLDLLVKRRTCAEKSKHDWKDVLVIGEHQASTRDWKAKFFQLCRYVRDIFSAQPTRRFVHAFTLLETSMELWVFDRCGAYSSGVFNIHDQPQMLVRALVGYVMMSDEELGVDTFIIRDGETQRVKVIEDITGKEMELELELNPIVLQNAVVCRGTTCFRSKDGMHVVKLSWPSDHRPPEATHLRLARDRGVKGMAQLVGCHDIASTKVMRDGLKFPAPHRFREANIDASTSLPRFESPVLSRSFGAFQALSLEKGNPQKRKAVDQDAIHFKKSRSDSQPSKLREQYEGAHVSPVQSDHHGEEDMAIKNRLFSCLVISPAGRPLKSFCSIKELLTALGDCIRAHQSLLEEAKILHRDISENNVIITDRATFGGTGMLIDLDLATVQGERAGGRHRTGTMEFMAIEVLRGADHTYRHDLESFFYVLLWICARRSWETEYYFKLKAKPAKSVLREWYGSSFENVARSKEYRMRSRRFNAILEEFPPGFNCVQPLCRQLRHILFPLDTDGELNLSTPTDPRKLYDPIIGAFDAAIKDLM
jgi:Fungal protein kinase